MTRSQALVQTLKLRDSQALRHRKRKHLQRECVKLTALDLIAAIRANGGHVPRSCENVFRQPHRQF